MNKTDNLYDSIDELLSSDGDNGLANFFAHSIAFDKTDKASAKEKREILAKGISDFQDGCEYLMARDESGTAAQLFEAIHNNAEQSMLLSAAAGADLNEESYHVLFQVALHAFETEAYEESRKMMLALNILFPEAVHPYLITANIAIIQKGLKEGIQIYEDLLKKFDDPIICFSAARCYSLEGSDTYKRKATQLYRELIQMLEKDSKGYESVLAEAKEACILLGESQ